MSAIEFSYSRYKEHQIPIIPIQIHSGGLWHEARVFVDSGATYTVLDQKESQRLGIPAMSGERMFIKVGDGGYISVNLVSLPMKIGNNVFTARIGFSKDLGVGFNVLGRKDVFDRYTICFHEKDAIVRFIPNEDK